MRSAMPMNLPGAFIDREIKLGKQKLIDELEADLQEFRKESLEANIIRQQAQLEELKKG